MALVGATSVAFASDDQAGPYPVVLASIEAAAEPDTTGAAIWGHIQDENYRENWDLWPGMDELYEGNQPHGMLLTTYVNDVALVALNHGETIMPAGAIVIKENYMPNRELAAVTVMYKSAGYNGDYNDWFFSKHLPDGTLDQMPNGMAMECRLPGCQGCHLARKDADYLYTPRPN
jgi:hypothetical protein